MTTKINPTIMIGVPGGVYQIRHMPSGRVYIGSSVNIAARLKRHRKMLRDGNHHNLHLQNLYNRDGVGAFEFEVLRSCGAEDVLQDEQAFIQSAPRDLLLNVCLEPTATVRGIRWKKAPEGIERSRQASIGRKLPPLTEAHKARIREFNTGKKMSAGAIDKWRKARAGWGPSPEAIEKVRQAHLGSKASDETKAKMSATHLGSVVSEETIEKLRVANLGRKHTEESKAKMRAAKLGTTVPEETRRKMSESHKRRFQSVAKGA